MKDVKDTEAYRISLEARAEVAEEKAREMFSQIHRAEWALDNCEASARKHLKDEMLDAVLSVIRFTRECLAPMGDKTK